jgi:hypothetical protein
MPLLDLANGSMMVFDGCGAFPLPICKTLLRGIGRKGARWAMTRAKFKRLFIVLLVPLLMAGAAFAFFENKGLSSSNVRCQISFTGSENCRSTGWSDFDDGIAKESPAWFDVKSRPFEENSFPQVFVSASQRQIDEVEILDVSPYYGTVDGPGSPLSELRLLTGQRISIIFGTSNEGPRPFNPLGCNELDYEKASQGVFIAGLCGIPNGVARVEFRVGSKGQADLEALKGAVDGEAASIRRIMIENYLIGTPIFVVLFLLISGVVWIVRRAASYVAAA